MMHVLLLRMHPTRFAAIMAVLTLATGCQLLASPTPTKDIVVTVFNESHDSANLAVLNHDGIPVGFGNPPIVPGASHADIVIRVPKTGEWGLWINRGEPGAGLIISNADVGSCTGRLPIQIRVGPDRELTWSGQPFC